MPEGGGEGLFVCWGGRNFNYFFVPWSALFLIVVIDPLRVGAKQTGAAA